PKDSSPSSHLLEKAAARIVAEIRRAVRGGDRSSRSFLACAGMIPTFDKVVIDSGPLFTVLTLNYVVRTNRRSLLQTIEEDIRRSVSMQNACLELFRSIRSILTTSHVIGEMQGLQT